MVVLYIVVGLAGLLTAVVSLQPSELKISRSTTMRAQPELIFKNVNVLHNWEAWSPWEKMDPAARKTYEGPPEGVGATCAWSGNNQIGQGRMTIIESRPFELVRFQLDFLKPIKVSNSAVFTFKPEGRETVVTWTMYGKSNFIGKALGLFLNCEKIVGCQFEKGLARLRSLSEQAAGS